MRKRLFVVASVYQLFNAINITEYENSYDDTSLVLLQTNELFSANFNIDYLKSIFENVWLVNFQPSSNKTIKLLHVLQELFKKKIFDVMIDKQFDEVLISGTEIYSKLIACKILREDTDLLFFEDGLASYFSVLDKKTKKKNDLILKLRFGINPLEYCKGVYIYEPKSVCNNTFGKQLHSIHKVKDRKFVNIDLNKIGRETPIIFRKRFIFLNAWFENKNEYDFQRKMTDLMLRNFGNDNCCIKTHPNELKRLKKEDGVEYITKKSSFEISNYYNDFSDSVFISVISSASLTPKLVYGQEPIIVFLYKMFQKKFGLWDGVDSTISTMIDLYSDKTRIYIPESIEEYERILLQLSERVLI